MFNRESVTLCSGYVHLPNRISKKSNCKKIEELVLNFEEISFNRIIEFSTLEKRACMDVLQKN